MRRVIFRKSLLRKNSTTRPSEVVENQGAQIFFLVQRADLSTIPEKMGVVRRSPDFWDFFQNRGPKREKSVYWTVILKQVSILQKHVQHCMSRSMIGFGLP